MRKTLLLFAVLFSIFTIDAQNLVSNGDFEKWDSWTEEPEDWGRYMSSMLKKSTDTQNGDYSVRMTMDNFGNFMSYIQATKITFEKGKTYDISFHYKLEKGALSKFTVSASYYKSGGIFPETLFSEEIKLPVSQNVWNKFSTSFVELSGTVLNNFQILTRSDNVDASILIDNVVIIDQSTASIGLINNENINIYFNASGNLIVQGVHADIVEIYTLDGKYFSVGDDNNVLPNGVYIVTVKAAGVVVSKKVIKE